LAECNSMRQAKIDSGVQDVSACEQDWCNNLMGDAQINKDKRIMTASTKTEIDN
jgi:hypothetical protein